MAQIQGKSRGYGIWGPATQTARYSLIREDTLNHTVTLAVISKVHSLITVSAPGAPEPPRFGFGFGFEGTRGGGSGSGSGSGSGLGQVRVRGSG